MTESLPSSSGQWLSRDLLALIVSPFGLKSIGQFKGNIVAVDRSFDFSQEEELISGRSYMSKIIMDKPNVLYNYTNLGFQNYYCATEEKELMRKLFFDSMRLGNILDAVSDTEPVFRDADIVGIDMKCLSWQAAADPLKGNPNGIDARTICRAGFRVSFSRCD